MINGTPEEIDALVRCLQSALQRAVGLETTNIHNAPIYYRISQEGIDRARIRDVVAECKSVLALTPQEALAKVYPRSFSE